MSRRVAEGETTNSCQRQSHRRTPHFQGGGLDHVCPRGAAREPAIGALVPKHVVPGLKCWCSTSSQAAAPRQRRTFAALQHHDGKCPDSTVGRPLPRTGMVSEKMPTGRGADPNICSIVGKWTFARLLATHTGKVSLRNGDVPTMRPRCVTPIWLTWNARAAARSVCTCTSQRPMRRPACTACPGRPGRHLPPGLLLPELVARRLSTECVPEGSQSS